MDRQGRLLLRLLAAHYSARSAGSRQFPRLSNGKGNAVRLRVRFVVVVTALVTLAAAPFIASGQSGGHPLGHPEFSRVWDRTDLPVEQGHVSRTWMWGPVNTPLLEEPYAEADDGTRSVQYTDKSRMELPVHPVDPDSNWFITQGLLATELMTGELQLGDSSFQQHQPADIPVAGDPTNNLSPTYAAMGQLINEPSRPAGGIITEKLAQDGTIADDPATAGYNVTDAYHISQTDNNIASVFWDFMNSSGTIYQNGQFMEGNVFSNPFYAIGYPVTEAYWGNVTVAGQPQEVLIQCFQRRCLTYTPNNSPGWQVESGNIGQHYYEWRYDVIGSGPGAPGSSCVTEGQSIQAALDAASPGDVICVGAGVYHELLTIETDDITLRGEPGAVLDGAGDSSNHRTGIIVRGNGVTVEKLQLRDFEGRGIDVSGAHGVIIQDLDFEDIGFRHISVRDSKDLEIRSTVIRNPSTDDSTVAIYLLGAQNMTVHDVDIEGSNFGIYFGSSSESVPSSGVIERSQIIADNTGVAVRDAEDLEIRNNQISGDSRAVGLTENADENIVIRDNELFSSYAGLLLFPSTDVSVIGNTISDNQFGVGMSVSPGESPAPGDGAKLLLRDNHIENNSIVGINVYGGGHQATIRENNLVDNDIGMRFLHDSNVTVKDNQIVSSRVGIQFTEDTFASIEENLISLNETAIRLPGGADATDVALSFNNIMDNDDGVAHSGAGVLQATHNYWGAADGPSGDGPGSGDSVSGDVEFDPWLISQVTVMP